MVKINIFQSLLKGIVTNPQQQFLEECNLTQIDHPQICIQELFAQQVERTPKAIALTFAGQQLTYEELDKRANQLAHHLHQLKVTTGELVGICVERSVEMIIGMLGILKAGAAYVPIDPEYPQERLDFILKDTQVSVLLTQAKWLQRISQHEPQLQTICLDSQWHTIARNSPLKPVCETSVDSSIYVIYTSGSTGKPKGVVVPHRGICNMLHWKQRNYQLSAADKVLQTYPFSFDASVCQIFWPLCFGGQLVMARPDGHKDTSYLVTTIEEEQITILGLVPSILRFLLEETGIENCLSLKHVVCGGEALGIELVKRFYECFAVEKVLLQNEYGPTEASMVTSFWSCIKDSNYTVSPIGRPIDNFQIYLLDQDLQKVPFGNPGELHIGGVGLASGYLNRPELTAEKFISNPFASQPNARLYKTGDLVRYLADGNLEFLGRIDNQVKLRGFRIELGEIDAILGQHLAVKETIAVVREDTPGDQCLVAYIVLRSQQPSLSELRSFLEQRLPSYMVPNTFVFIDSMPLTHNGKVDRRALPAPAKSDVPLEANFASSNNSIEETLVTIWSDILGVQPIGIHDNFFELGGHSLLLTQVMSRCRKAFSIKIPLQSLFQKPTIAELAEIIAQSQAQSQQQDDVAQYQAIPRCQNRDNLPLSFAQQRLWLLDRLEPNSAFYNVPVAVRLKGNLNVSALQKALDELVSHHEILRTNYISEKGNLIQTIKAPQSVKLQIIDLQQYEHTQQDHLQKLLKQEIHRPFDLASDMMLRGCLLQLAPQQYVLLLVMHHIASDGWSIDILWEHLTELYSAFIENKPNPLAELPIQYADYAVWQKASLTNEVLERQLKYWKRQLMSVEPVLEIPTDRPRPPVQTYRGASQSVTISKALTRSLKKLCQQEDATLYMALLAAFQTFLCRYSGQEDILVGSPIAGRDRAEVENLIGFFVNTLVLRTDFSDNPSFQEVLRRVRSVTLDAYSNQDLPFDKLVEAISPERSLSYNSLFQIMFVLQNAGKQNDRQLMGLTKTPVQLETETAKFDLTLSVAEQDGMLVGTWNYNTDLFDAVTIERMMGHFETLLTAIVANPQQQIAKLPLLTKGEQQFLEECNLTQIDHPQICIHELFAQQVERTPKAIALKFAGQATNL